MSLSAEKRLSDAILNIDAGAARQALRDGANVNAVRGTTIYDLRTPLLEACGLGYDQIIRVLLDAGADPRWRGSYGDSAITEACNNGNLSTVQLLINHDNGLQEIVDNEGRTPLFYAIRRHNFDLVRFLLDSGADPHHGDRFGTTALMIACQFRSLEIVRLLMTAGADVEARDRGQQTALHHSAFWGSTDSEILLELLLQHNANMFALDVFGQTPYDMTCRSEQMADHLLEIYVNKLTQDHGHLALHELLKVAKYSFAKDRKFHPPLQPLRIILPLGKLTLTQFRTLLRRLEPELIRNRDGTGKLPIHIACQTNAPVEVLVLILELDPTTLHIADFTGALPIHLLCGTLSATEYTNVRYLVEQGGVGILAARSRRGLLPLHVLCRSTNAPLRVVQYLIRSFPGSVAMRTNAGQYPFMMAAAGNSASASLSVIYELIRAKPGLLVPN